MFGVLIIGRLGSNLENKSSDLKKKKNFIRQNQKGFTFVELLVAILLLALVSVTVAGFLSVINQNYRHNQKEVDLQLESQTVMNQLRDLMIDTSLGITKNETATQTDIFVYNDTFYYRITWLRDEKSLYVRTYPAADAPEDPFDKSQSDIMSYYVKDFVVHLDQVQSKRIVGFDIIFEIEDGDTQQYIASNNLSLRNNLAVGNTRDEIYDDVDQNRAEVYPSSIDVNTDIYVWPGSSHVLNATVRSSGNGVPSQAVTWVYENDGLDGGPVLSDERTDATNTYVNQGVIYIGASEKGRGLSAGTDPYCFYMCARIPSVDELGNAIMVYSTVVKVHIMVVEGLELSDDIDSTTEKEVARGVTIKLKATLQGYNLDFLSIYNQGGLVMQANTTGTSNPSPFATLQLNKSSGNTRQQLATLSITPTFSEATSITVSASMEVNGQYLNATPITYIIEDVENSAAIMDMLIKPSETGKAGQWLRGETKTIIFSNVPDAFVYKIGGSSYLNPDYQLYIQYYFENSKTGAASSETSYMSTTFNYVKLIQFQSNILNLSGQKAKLLETTPFAEYDRVTVTAYIVAAGESLANAAGKTESQTFEIPPVRMGYKKNLREDSWSDTVSIYITDKVSDLNFYMVVKEGFEENVYPTLSADQVQFLNVATGAEVSSEYEIVSSRTGMSDNSYQVVFHGDNNNGEFKQGLEAMFHYKDTADADYVNLSYREGYFEEYADEDGYIYAKNGAKGFSPYDYMAPVSELDLSKDEKTYYYLNSVSRFYLYWEETDQRFYMEKQLYTQSTWMTAYAEPACTTRLLYYFDGNKWVLSE